eukprot:CAMPEP_0197403826 /NCGR_PEP_ID=MMETSP1165-20131217/22054_1 /TAXON_ID=284809 /ORGANISM="Chrysocystis fragilis, Strain CCMP3189" /LENGTH=245 /DNA_ID=CAMNT_0042930053 /DNA_START=32 /DNA_END=766 /DNA_ORIENTATION=+
MGDDNGASGHQGQSTCSAATLIERIRGWCIVRLTFAALSLTPVLDLGSDVWLFAYFVLAQWRRFAIASAIVVYLSWRFFLVYASMYWPKPTLKVIVVVYIPGLLFPFWNVVMDANAKAKNDDDGGAPPSADAHDTEDPEEAKMDVSDEERGGDVDASLSPPPGDATVDIFALGGSAQIQNAMFEYLHWASRIVRCKEYNAEICFGFCDVWEFNNHLLFYLCALLLWIQAEIAVAVAAIFLGPWLL